LAAADDPVHHRHLHHRLHAAVRRAAAAGGRRAGRHRRQREPVRDAQHLPLQLRLEPRASRPGRRRRLGDARPPADHRRGQLVLRPTGPPVRGRPGSGSMTMTSPPPPAPVKLAPAPDSRAPKRPSRCRMGAGQQLKGGPFAYVALAVVGFGSLLPLYWTLVAASRTQDEVLASTPPFLPGGKLIENIQTAWEQANLGKAILNSVI